MPNKTQSSRASASVIKLFKRSSELLKNGSDVRCPVPSPQAQSTGKVGGSACLKLYHSKRAFTNHAVDSHGVPRSATTSGTHICERVHPFTKVFCGHQFKREDHLKRHQGRKDCAGFATKSSHLFGCKHIFADGKICGLSFKKKSVFDRHLLSKTHGGLGARESASQKKNAEKKEVEEDEEDDEAELERSLLAEIEEEKMEVAIPRIEEEKMEIVIPRIQVPKKISPDVDRRAKVRDAMGWNKTISAQRKALCDRKRKFSIFKETNMNQVVRTSVFKVKRNAFKEVQVLDEEVDDPMPI